VKGVVSISRINKQKCKVKKDTTIYERGFYLAYTDIILTNSGSNQTTLGHLMCSYLLTLPTQVSGILFKDRGSNGTILFYPCSKEPVKMINRANTLKKKQRCSSCINQSYAFYQVFHSIGTCAPEISY
jgi:hypothetical protein